MKYNSKGRFESPNSSLRRSSSLPSSINSYCNPYAASTNNIQQHGGQPLPFTTHHSPPTLSSQYMEQFNNNYHQHLSIFNNPSNDNSRTTFTNSSTPTSFCHQPTSDFTGMQIPSNVQDFSHNAKIVSNDMMICQSDNFPQQHCNLGCQSGVTTSMNQAIPSHNPSLSNNYLHLTITPNFQSFDQFLKENSHKYQPSSVNDSLDQDDTKRKRIISQEDKEEEKEHHQIKMTRSGTSTSCAFNMF